MTQPPRLLVSVRNLDEAREALAGDCDILDIKEPANGPLGMAAVLTIADVATEVRLSTPDVPVSAALGELRDWETQRSSVSLPPALTFAKIGLSGMRTRPDWQHVWQTVRGHIDQSGGAELSWVAVAYADDELAQAPAPRDVVSAAAETGCRILLIDTFTKDGRTLLDFQSPSDLRAIATQARAAGLQLALAGSLRADLLPQLAEVRPDIIAIRSAACRGGERSASISASAVAQFRRALRAAAPVRIDVPLRTTGRSPDGRVETFRILDAAANRAREGLRVVEDYVRFTLDDADLTALLKDCRHELTDSLRAAGARSWIRARETQADVGTELSTPAERLRSSPGDVLQANLKRVQEATRTLEEFGKIVSSAFAERVGRLRYRLYTVEKALLATQAGRERLHGCELCLLLTSSLCTRGVENVVRGAIQAGVGIIQIREKSMSDRQLLEHARSVRDSTRRAGVLLIMNDRPDLASLCDADGVHVGQDELSVRDARRIVGLDRLVGVSTHSIEQARQAVLDGADYVGVGPVFPSTTKPFTELAGLEFVRQAAARITLPWFAIGGLHGGNIAAAREAGARRVAVSSAVCAADDPEAAARQLLAAIRA